MRIGMLGVDFEVHEPPELVERCAQLGARFARGAARRLRRARVRLETVRAGREVIEPRRR